MSIMPRVRSALKVSALSALLALASCAGQDAETKAIIALAVACDNYSAALETLTPRKASMSLSAVQKVDATNKAVDPLCKKDATIDPVVAISTVSQAVGLLRGLTTEK